MMKPLLPTLKEKKRYVAYEVYSDQKKNWGKTIISELNRILGVFDSSVAGLQTITFDKKSQQGLFRVSVTGASRTRAALTLISELEGVPVRIRTLGVSGIINKAERFMNQQTASASK